MTHVEINRKLRVNDDLHDRVRNFDHRVKKLKVSLAPVPSLDKTMETDNEPKSKPNPKPSS